jgi:hypothetical protein
MRPRAVIDMEGGKILPYARKKILTVHSIAPM